MTTRTSLPASRELMMQGLRELRDAHPLWRGPLLQAFHGGALTRDDVRLVFEQYWFYSRSFTRYIAGLMASLDDDLMRARLSQNLWEEGGGAEPEKRHANLFRRFLDSIGVDAAIAEAQPFTQHFVRAVLDYTRSASALEAAAFLSLGTEGIVVPLYSELVTGLRAAGVPERDLEFFHVHLACADEHAATLEEIVWSFSGDPGWFETCVAAATYALDLQARFFDALFSWVRERRLRGMLDRLQRKQSLLGDEMVLSHHATAPATALYENRNDRLDIRFSVDRLPFKPEVLDPRVVHIHPGKRNERHTHAHETIFYVVHGSGYVTIDDRRVEVAPGAVVFVPRWAMHQTVNTGDGEMIVLAVTDFNLTGKAFIGDHEKTARARRRTPPPPPPSPEHTELIDLT